MLRGAAASSSSSTSAPALQQATGGASPHAVHEQQQQQANNQLNHTTVNIPAPAFNGKGFEDKIRSAKRGALLVAGLQLLSRFAGFFALTWATVVLLGGFASVLRLLDFYLITILLLLEGLRLFIIQLFSKPLTHDRGQPSQAIAVDVPQSAALVFLLASASLVSTIVRLSLSRSHHLSEKSPSTVQSNLPISLYVFYSLVVINATLAMASALRRPLLRELCDRNQISWGQLLQIWWSSAQEMDHINQNSLKCYHDEVYMTAMEVGLREANQLDFLDFAFKKLGWDYKRSIRSETVMELNRDMISYLYHNKQGIAMAFEHLKSGDVWQQQVAASLPGFWAKEGKVQSQIALLWALRDRMYGGGKDADAALTSIECLGEKWTADLAREGRAIEIPTQLHPFLMNDPAAGTNVVDTLVQLLLEPLRPNLVFQVRAFEACCPHPHVLSHLFSADMQQLQEAGDGDAEATICDAMQDVIVGVNPGAGAGRLGPGSKLQMLCLKLHSVVAPRPVQPARCPGTVGPVFWAPTTKIYAANALMTLLCYGRQDFLRQQTRDFLAAMVKEGIDPAGWTTPSGRPWRYSFTVKDLMVMEKLRWRLGLDAYRGWSKVRLVLRNGRELSGDEKQATINCLVAQARQM